MPIFLFLIDGESWDGKIDGKESSDGTYSWILSYTTIKNETVTKKGFLTLIR